MTTATTGKATTRIENGNIFISERLFDAPRDLVFEVFTSADHITRWWGPEGWPTVYCTLDFRVGGKWHYCMKGPEGESWGIARYTEINRPESFTYMDAFSNAEGEVVPPEMQVQMVFEDHAGRTLIRGITHVADEETLKNLIEFGMEEGLNSTLDNLDRYLQELKTQAAR